MVYGWLRNIDIYQSEILLVCPLKEFIRGVELELAK